MLLALSGCDRVWRLDEVPGDAQRGPTDDSGVDARDADAAPTACYGSGIGLVRVCPPAPIAPSVTLGGSIDTTGDTRCLLQAQVGGPELCVIAGEMVSVSAALSVTGSRPLVLVGTKKITVMGSIDASSGESKTGPGAQLTCGTAGNGTGTVSGAGGGAGASFAFAGGGAAPGGSINTTAHPPDPPISALTNVRGGCPGYSGGYASASGNTSVALGGAGGGAVYLIAGEEIAQTGTINASGSGGQGGPTRGGGGGGGSGGVIVLDAPTIAVSGYLIARGGGGGSGGSDTNPGFRGHEATDTVSDVKGGMMQTVGSGSGLGWPGCGAPTGTTGGTNSAGTAGAGGGGGGGACGFILVFATAYTQATSNTANPAVTRMLH